MSSNALPPFDLVKEFLDYDPETGIFTWKERRLAHFKTKRAWAIWNSRFSGKIAGYKNDQDYTLVAIQGHIYRSHRLAWLYVYGNEPEEEIDHIDRNPQNNKISNLRKATRAQNMANLRVSREGYEGIVRRGNRFRVYISTQNKRSSIGTYASIEDARVAYAQAAVAARGDYVPDEIKELAKFPVPKKCTAKGQVRGFGVTKHGDKFRAFPYINGERVHLGVFSTFEQAAAVVNAARDGRL